MTFRVAHWITLDDSLAFQYTGEEFECTNGKWHVFTFKYANGRYSSTYSWQVPFVYTLVNLQSIV